MDGKGKVAIVTGSATGVGAEVARQLAERGCNVVINYTRSEAEAKEAEAACKALGVETLMVQADVSVDADCRRMAQAALDKWGRIDVLVNNAGTSKFVAHHDLEGLTAEDFQRIYAVNVIGPYQMTRAVAPAMQKQGSGSVVNVSSLAGVRGVGSSIAYAASKGALNNMTMSLARALGPEIRVNTVCPGFIATPILDTIPDAVMEKMVEKVPLGRLGQPEEIARVYAFLASDDASYINGAVIEVSGGIMM